MAHVIGLTGAIASGKSLVGKFLRQLGCVVIDADKVGHACYQPGTACFTDLVEVFGDTIVSDDGTINRRVLGGIVFSDKKEMDKLESVVWPHIRDAIEERLAELKKEGCQLAVVEAAVLLEAGWDGVVDEIWSVSSPRDLQRTRLMARNNLSPEDADKRLNAQAALTFTCEGAVNIVNDGSIADLAQKTKELLKTRYGLGVDELVMHVDENNDIVGNIERSKVREDNLWHRATYIVIRNSSDELYVQKRTYIKDYCPGYFDPVTGGVVAAGESYELSAQREAEEELGVTAPLTFMGTFKHEDGLSKVWGGLFDCVWDGDVHPQPSEVEHVEMITLPEIFKRHKAGQQLFTPDSINALEHYQTMRARASKAGQGRFALLAAAGVALVAFAVLSR